MQEHFSIAQPLLTWYYRHRRILPFRENPTPYNIWVSEIMLQQTRVNAALPYYERFINRLPNIAALAACGEEELHKLWQGLGYYSRVRNLQKAAQVVVREYGGQLPADYRLLCTLPGIGPYTAGAIASIAFNLPAVAVDGNVLRVFSRLMADDGDIFLPAVKKRITQQVAHCQPADLPGDYNQAIMELGALVCLPGRPLCGECPLRDICAGFKKGIAASLPFKAAKKPKEKISVCVFVLHTPQGVIVQQRPAKGLLAGLWQPVMLENITCATKEDAQQRAADSVPGAVLQRQLPASKHIFTHKIWEMQGWLGTAPPLGGAPAGFKEVLPKALQNHYTVPSAFKAYLPFMLQKDFK